MRALWHSQVDTKLATAPREVIALSPLDSTTITVLHPIRHLWCLRDVRCCVECRHYAASWSSLGMVSNFLHIFLALFCNTENSCLHHHRKHADKRLPDDASEAKVLWSKTPLTVNRFLFSSRRRHWSEGSVLFSAQTPGLEQKQQPESSPYLCSPHSLSPLLNNLK